MSAYSSLPDVSTSLDALINCAHACRTLTNPSNGVVLFSYPPKFIQLLNDCAAACDIAILLIERKSHIITDFMEICEEFSLECARECSNYEGEEFQQCTKACEAVARVSLSYISETSS
jgi:hypothetical protein